MATFQTLVTRILDELNRTDLNSQAGAAIRSAVEHYETQHLGFNETLTATTATAGTYRYNKPDGFLHERMVSCDYPGGHRYPMRKMSWEEFQERYDENLRGQPTGYVFFGDGMYIHPIPDSQTYSLVISYTFSLGELSDSTSNAWTNAFERVIRHRAKADLLENVIRGQEGIIEGQAQRAREAEAYMLMYENNTQVGYARLRRRGSL